MNLKIANELNQIIKSSPRLLNDPNSYLQVINGTFHIDLDTLENPDDLISVANQVDDAVLGQYFSKIWQPETKRYKYSGLSIIDEINKAAPNNVIDVGCGFNEFKGKINNLIGIDPYNKRADICTRLEEFDAPVLYDVAICFGSINFGSTDKILNELKKLVSIMKTGGVMYFRVNPGLSHTAPESKWIDFFDWNSLFISNSADMLNCKLETIRQDSNNRIYFVLTKK